MCVLQTNAGKLVLRCTVNFGGQITGLHDTAPPNLAFQFERVNAFSLFAKTFFISGLTTTLKAFPLSHRCYYIIVKFYQCAFIFYGTKPCISSPTTPIKTIPDVFIVFHY